MIKTIVALWSCALALASTLGCGSSKVSDGGDGSSSSPGAGGTASSSPSDGGGACPAQRPMQGTPCTPEGLGCLLGKNATGCDSDSASCNGGKWQVFSTPGCAAPRDSGADGADAGNCAQAGGATACTSCCNAAFPGSGTELVFDSECQTCATCSNKTPCGTNASPPADSACVACLQPKLSPASAGWTQCQQSAPCRDFVACFATCPGS